MEEVSSSSAITESEDIPESYNNILSTPNPTRNSPDTRDMSLESRDQVSIISEKMKQATETVEGKFKYYICSMAHL